jgi:hypothetical protein
MMLPVKKTPLRNADYPPALKVPSKQGLEEALPLRQGSLLLTTSCIWN